MLNDIRLMNSLTRAVLAVLILVLLFAGYRWLALQTYFDYRVIMVRGAQQVALRYVDDATVRSAALPRLRGNFFLRVIYMPCVLHLKLCLGYIMLLCDVSGQINYK